MKKNPYVGRFVFLFVCKDSVRDISYEYNSSTNNHMNMKFDMMIENNIPECRKKSGSDISHN